MKKTTILLSLALLLVSTVNEVVAQKGKLYTFPIGMQAYTYRASFPKNVAATLDTLKMLGITELEGGAAKGTTPEEFRKMCEERGISIPATGGGYEQLVKDPLAAAKTAKALGAKYLMCAWIPHKVKGGFTFEEAKKAVEDFNMIGKVLKENGITFCYHNHGYEFQPYEGGTLFDYIVKNTNPEYVSFEIDILWAFHGGAEPVALMKKYGKRFKLVHLKDLRKGVKGDLTGGTPLINDVVLGTGQVDVAGVIREAKKIGIKHYFIEDESPTWYEQVPKSIAYLKSL
ncbi:sugar phosphate isomerase/epimerase family protein [Runella slithyformis]|uniref:Xylose isomerase domain-containing protein TIM barrel n=1 Tax=Runella slithyformis (strain ATCC 29530 / DSM 19594 / LMG 11500 / NCIMB 11436 / LSU 4) TaxID=761193 RepID=A0A7U3ZHB3_RUNSL|nr:sugar phosphate isomerase/epimerase [Runella slithyformis]AEI47236.1 Xylose isomerase domain-containing protein TIM barrel [Runella slithyformis DSM 19594]